MSPWLDAPAPGSEPVQASGRSDETGGDGTATVRTNESPGVSQTSITLDNASAAEEVVIFREVNNGFEQLELSSSNVATDGGNAVVTLEMPGFSEFVVGMGTGPGISTFEVANLSAAEEVTDSELFEVAYTSKNIGEEPPQ